MPNQMVHTMLVKKSQQSQQTFGSWLVQNDKMVFLMLVQIGYFLTRFANKKTKFFNSANKPYVTP